MKRMIRSRFMRFLLVGGFAAALNFLSRIVLSQWLSYPLAIVGAFLVGISTAFVLSRSFVFERGAAPIRVQALWFTVVNLAALVQTLAVSLLLAHYLLPMLGITRGAETIAHAVGVAIPVLTSYIGHKRLSFRTQ
jgi:putative flippase GtrA